MTKKEFDLIFPTEKSCVDYYVNTKFDNNLTCPHCGSSKHLCHNNKRIKVVQCNNCNKTFSIFAGTIFEKSHTKLRDWFYAINLFLNNKKGISSLNLVRETGVSRKCALRMLRQIRLAMSNESKYKFEGVIEIDETYVGGKPRRNNIYDKDGKFLRKRPPAPRGRATNKIAVAGITERCSGKVIAKIMPPNKEGKKLSGEQLFSFILPNCEKNITAMTDEYKVYNILDKNGYEHHRVNHYMEQYSLGNGVHTNNIESFWSLVKRIHHGTYHQYSLKYAQSYLDECCFRRNHFRDKDIFESLIKQSFLDRKKKENNNEKDEKDSA